MKRQNSSLLTNMSTYLLLQIINLLVGIVLPRMYLKVYGSEINGIVSTINSFISYFSYLEAGIGLTLIHSLFSPLAKNEYDKTNKILSFSKRQYKRISYAYLALVIAFSLIFPFINSNSKITTFEFSALVFVIGFYGALDFFTMSKYRVLLTADRKEYVISCAMIIAQLLRFVFVSIFLQFDLNIVFVKFVPIITLLVRSVILKVYVKKTYPHVSFVEKYEKDIVNTDKRWDALFLQISINSSKAIPVIIVSQILGYIQANIYATYNLVVSALIAVVSSLSSGVSPMIGKTIAMGKSVKDIYNVYEWIVSVILTIVFTVCSVMMLPFIKLYTSVASDVDYMSVSYAILFPLWAALFTFRMPATALINATALYKENRWNNILNLAIQVVVGILLTFLCGINGILFTMIIAAIQRNVYMNFVIDKKVISGSLFYSVKRQSVMSLLIVLGFIVGKGFVPINSNVVTWIIYAVIFSVISLILSLIVFYVTDIKTAKEALKFIYNKFQGIEKR